MIKKSTCKFCFIFLVVTFYTLTATSQLINVINITQTGRFNTCLGSNTPTITANLISTNVGSSVIGGTLICLNNADSSTIRITITNLKWNKNPNLEWLHGLFLTANTGIIVSPVSIPPGFIPNNQGCIGTCPSGSGINGGPGFYFDSTAGNTCCSGTIVNDGIPCNNWGDVTISCSAYLSITFDITFCNSIITTSSYQFVLRGSSDGTTGCYNFNDGLSNTISFNLQTQQCQTQTINPNASFPMRTCIGNTENFITTLAGSCVSNTIQWWDAPVGGTLIGVGSPFVYDPIGTICPSGTMLFATCDSSSARVAFSVPGICNQLIISNISTTNGTCSSFGSIDSVMLIGSQGFESYTLFPGGITNSTGSFTNLIQSTYTLTVTDASGCSTMTSILILTPQQITVTASNVSACVGSAVSLVGNPMGGIFSKPNPYSGPSTTYTYTYTDSNGCSATSAPATITMSACIINLNLKLFIEGYYNGTNAMVPTLMNQGVILNNSITDIIIVELHSITFPYNVVSSTTAFLNTDGTASCSFSASPNLYYIVVKHRNAIETWSANPILLGLLPVSYDFTSSANKAFGSNMKEVETGVWAFHCGDFNLDDNIDLIDVSILESDIVNFQFGYLATDLDGDGNVDLLDSPILESNVNSFIFSNHP